MLKQKYFLTGIFILSAERQPIKLSWRKIVWLLNIYHGLSMKELKDMYIALIKHLLLVQFLFMLSMLKKV